MEGDKGDRAYEEMPKKEAKARTAQLGECQGINKDTEKGGSEN